MPVSDVGKTVYSLPCFTPFIFLVASFLWRDSSFIFQEEKLRKAIDEIESKYGSLLKQAEKEASQSAGGQHENRADRDSDKTDSAAIPGLDVGYDADSGPRDNKSSKNRKQLEDKGNSRPPRKQDKGEERKSRGEDRKNKGDRNTNRTGQRQEEEKERQARVERKKKEREEDERVMEALEAREEARRKAASMDNSAVAPAAMQTSLFIGVGVCPFCLVFCLHDNLSQTIFV